jgi:hypothetical protein
MSSTPIETLVKETRAAFIIAKADGQLDAGEVIQIAIELSQKVQKLANLSGSEKKALLLLSLKRGLETSGGLDSLPGFETASAETKRAFEDELLKAASATIDAVFAAVSGKLDLRKPSSWAFCLPACLSIAKTVVPKDQALLIQAVEYASTVVKAPKEEPAETPVTKVEEVAPTVPDVAPVSVADATIPGTAETQGSS